MNLFWAFILVAVGLAILIKGADWLVDGAVAIARHFGMGPLIIGLTIVAMGTSAPEVAASVGFSLSNAADAAVGNVYGSNVANLALVGGLCALIRPITVTRLAAVRDIPIMLAVSVLLYGLFYNLHVSRLEGALMLVLFAGIISFMIHSERKKAIKDRQMLEDAESVIEQAVPHPPKTLWVSSVLIILGLVCLTVGAKMTVTGAIELGERAGLSDAVIGSTIIAVGTSLPELMTCVVAALKGHDDLSIGNLVGSNIFNMLLVIGAAAVFSPLSISARMAGTDYALMLTISLLFSLFVFFSKRISRFAGGTLVVVYAGYLVYLFVFNR
jgi:cation:H+ antiporter